MWLLNARTRRLQNFNSGDVPRYAILSHRWEEEEVTFEAINDQPEWLKGYQKIDRCCKQALSGGARFDKNGNITKVEPIEWVWIDTCCIDKKSSAELSEAINSMYKWYANAEICYAFLFDVPEGHDLKRSSWFTRGWTLQELLAPKQVFFFNRNWNMLGYRSPCSPQCSHEMCEECKQFCHLDAVSKITNIPEKALCGFDPDVYSIAERMSWAAERITTREEDAAYCLLGIFGIQMPLLYGEGEDAYRRLQEEIMKVSNDLSLFIWEGSSCRGFGMLAYHPSCFKVELQRDTLCGVNSAFAKRLLSTGYTAGNGGLTIKLKLQHYSGYIFIAWLEDPHILERDDMNQTKTFRRAMFLESDLSRNRYQRVRVHGRCHMLWKVNPLKAGTRKVQIARGAITDRYLSDTRLHFPPSIRPFKLFIRDADTSLGHSEWQEQPLETSTTGLGTEIVVKPLASFGFVCCLSAKTRFGSTLDLFIGFDVDFTPICLLQCNDDFFSNPLKRLFYADQCKLLQHFRDLLPEHSKNRNSWNTRESLIAMRNLVDNVEIQLSDVDKEKTTNTQFVIFEPCETGYRINLDIHSIISQSKKSEFDVLFGDFWAASPHTSVAFRRGSWLDSGFLASVGASGSLWRILRGPFSRPSADSSAIAIHVWLAIEASISMMAWKPSVAAVLFIITCQCYFTLLSYGPFFSFILLASILVAGVFFSMLWSARTADWKRRFATDY